MSMHQSARPKTETWFTPPAIIEALGGAESFDLDPCSHINRPWPTAKRHLTIADDGLRHDWHGRVWLNPPYSNPTIGRFLQKMATHGQGVALIFARTETEAFFAHVWDAASGLLFLRGRLHFCRMDGTPAPANCGAPPVLVAYGSDDLDMLAQTPIDGQFVPLRLPLMGIGFAAAETWAKAVGDCLARAGGELSLRQIYEAFEGHAKTRTNRHFKEKIRQVLQRGEFERVRKGVWRLAV